MTEHEREQTANRRFQLIAPIVKHPETVFSHGQRYEILNQIARGEFPGLPKTGEEIGVRTLERYLKLFKEGGKEALKPKQRTRPNSIPRKYLQAAVELRKENPSRSIYLIITMLEESGRVPKGILKQSTVYDYFTKEKLTRPALGTKTGHYTRYGALHRAEILQGDVHYTLKLPDPTQPDREKQVYLFAWLDDYSRLVSGRFYWKESRPALEDSLKKWILTYGVPESCYCDNGSVYSSHYMNNICSSLGIQLHHSRPYKPAGRGKIEKFFQLVESSFKYEAELLIKQNKNITLEKLNDLFVIWLDRFYNQRKHSATKQTPIGRWESCEHPLKRVNLDTLYEAFLYKDTRSVSKTGIFSVDTNEYEVEPFLCGKKIEIRFDPYDLSHGVQVYYEGQRFQDAIPAKLHRHSKKGFDYEHVEVVLSSGLNFLEQLAKEDISKRQSINFSAVGGNEL